jgi:IS1 family transposase
MNKLSTAERKQVIACLVDGNSLRATTRITGIHRTTVMKLLNDLGAACQAYQNNALRDLSCKLIQCDEIWSFVGCKEKNVTEAKKLEGQGDCWTWVGMDAESKLVCAWLVGSRDADSAEVFMKDLAERLANRVQLTTDGHRAYLTAVEGAFGLDIDYAMLVKQYGPNVNSSPANRYSQPECTGVKKKTISGNPSHDLASTSYIERQNLTMRMNMRRFTRLTNAFSKKIESHMAAISLHYMHYNFARVHQSLRITPAMAAGISDHVWSLEEIISLLD